MSTITINRTFTVSGVLTDATTFKLKDQTNTYGVKRDDTNAVVVAAGTAFTRLSVGTYSYSFTAPAPGLKYTYGIEAVYNNQTVFVSFTFTAPLAGGNKYCTVAQMQQMYDSRTIAELTGDTDAGVLVPATLQLHLDMQASELESILYGRYTIAANNVPLVLTRWVGVKAWASLFGRRAKLPQELARDLDWANKWIEDLQIRKVGIPGYTPDGQMSIISDSPMADGGQPQGGSRFNNIAFFDKTVTRQP
jgi:phage gp36-like protein